MERTIYLYDIIYYTNLIHCLVVVFHKNFVKDCLKNLILLVLILE